jgi:hypothetical protein
VILLIHAVSSPKTSTATSSNPISDIAVIPTKSWRIKKAAGKGTLRTSLEIAPNELERAKALTNITTNYQRAELELIVKILQKKAVSLTTTADAIACTFSLSRSSSPSLPAFYSSLHTSSSSSLPSSLLPVSKSTLILQTALAASMTNLQSASTALPSQSPRSWEDVAQDNINQRKLSLDRAWSQKSWKQEANNEERLKLLKNDGYDIIPLQGKKVTADQIITALLAHVVVCSLLNGDLSPVALITVVSGPAATSVVEEDVVSQSVHAYIKQVSSESKSPRENGEKEDVHISGVYQGRVVPMNECEAVGRQSHITSQMVSQKRKHDHGDDNQPDWHDSNPQRLIILHTTRSRLYVLAKPYADVACLKSWLGC